MKTKTKIITVAAICLLGFYLIKSVEPMETTLPENNTAIATAETETVSREFKNAISKAETYSDMHLSKTAIYNQLTSEYGEKFPHDAAQYAVDNLQTDWNYNALEMAKFYQENMSMSKAAIYDQLVSDFGEKFTAEQAQYAVDNLG